MERCVQGGGAIGAFISPTRPLHHPATLGRIASRLGFVIKIVINFFPLLQNPGVLRWRPRQRGQSPFESGLSGSRVRLPGCTVHMFAVNVIKEPLTKTPLQKINSVSE